MGGGGGGIETTENSKHYKSGTCLFPSHKRRLLNIYHDTTEYKIGMIVETLD